MVYNANEYYFSAMEKDQPYYFQIEAINENTKVCGNRKRKSRIDC